MAQRIATTQKRSSPLLTAWRECASGPSGLTRVINAAASRLQKRLGMTYLMGYPTTMAIEVTNLCQGGCVLCPVGEGRLSRPFGYLDWNNFRKVVDEVVGYVRFIGLYNWGDPLLHKHIYDMIRYVKDRDIHTRISSNLHAFKIDDAERLVASGLDGMGVAIHGLSEETYRTYQPHHRLETVIEKVRAIMDARRRLGSSTPDIRLDFIVRRDNEHEAGDLPAFAEKLGVGYLMEEVSLNLRLLPYDRHMQPRGLDEQALRGQRLSRMEQWLPRDASKVNPVYRQVQAEGGVLPGADRRVFRCEFPWQHMIVCWDGDVNLCCGSYEKRHSVGNVFTDSVRSVWNNPAYRSARQSLQRQARAGRPWVLCDSCPGMLL